MRPRRVLVVANDAATRRHIRDNLFVSGYSVFEAVDRRTTIEAVEDFSPHAVVVDLTRAPNGDGLATISAAIDAAERRPIVVALSGEAPGALASDARAAGADDHLEHPFCIGELLVRVDRLLGVALPPPRNETRPREQPRFSDLIVGENPITLIWVTLGGIEQLQGVGIDGHRWVSETVEPLMAKAVQDVTCWWAGTERIVAIGAPCTGGVELASQLQGLITESVEALCLPIDLKIKVRAGIRRWSEGRPSFIARVTGRLSHGGLPTSLLSDGPPVLANVAGLRSGIDRQAARRELGRLISN